MDKITTIIHAHYRRTATPCRTCGRLNCVILAHDNQAKPPKKQPLTPGPQGQGERGKEMKKAEMKQVISKIIQKEADYVLTMRGETNPQIRDMVQYADGRIDTLIAVLNSLEGSDVLLKLLAE